MSYEHELELFEKHMDFADRFRSGFKIDHDTELDSLLSIDSFSRHKSNSPGGWIEFISRFNPAEKLLFSRTVGFFNRNLSKRLGRNATINDVKSTPISDLLKKGQINENTVKVFDEMFGIHRAK